MLSALTFQYYDTCTGIKLENTRPIIQYSMQRDQMVQLSFIRMPRSNSVEGRKYTNFSRLSGNRYNMYYHFEFKMVVVDALTSYIACRLCWDIFCKDLISILIRIFHRIIIIIITILII